VAREEGAALKQRTGSHCNMGETISDASMDPSTRPPPARLAPCNFPLCPTTYIHFAERDTFWAAAGSPPSYVTRAKKMHSKHASKCNKKE
jgi:hypothetical protein